MTTWSLPFLLTSVSTDQTAPRSSAGCCFISWNVYTTSSAVIGWPSVHFTPLRIVNVIDLLSDAHSNLDASQGVVSPLLSALTNTSGS